MTSVHRSDSIILFFVSREGARIADDRCRRGREQPSHEVPTMYDDRDHVISVTLSHEDWQEFVKLQPQPAAWLRERIQEILAASKPAETANVTAQIELV
jgi:hypothetical protein